MDHPDPNSVDPTWWEAALPRVRAFVRRRLRPELAQVESPSDIVQSACRELLVEMARAADLRSQAPVVHWRLLRLALRKIVQKHRYHTALKRSSGLARSGTAVDHLIASGTGPLEMVLRDERATALARAMHRLSEQHRRIIEWVHFERLPHAETAQRLGVSEDASKMLLSRAMVRLAMELGLPAGR